MDENTRAICIAVIAMVTNGFSLWIGYLLARLKK